MSAMPENARPMLAAITISLVVTAAAAFWGFDSAVTAGVTLRSALLSGALWLAWPEITQRSLRNVLLIGAGVLVVALRPRTAWVVIPALLVWAGMRKR